MRVVVVGAGLAGLTAATHLIVAGHDVVVLDGRDEIGGRTRSRPISGDVIELGAQFISRNHRRMRKLVAHAGLHLTRGGALATIRGESFPTSTPPNSSC